MNLNDSSSTVGVLLSGGLDSSILLAQLLRESARVQPFYIRCGLVWEAAELNFVRRFLASLVSERLSELVVLDLPLADLYENHWSIHGLNTPGADTPDEAVFLPGRNAVLIIKAALWCQIHGIERLALAPLASNPFADASDEFFQDFQDVLRHTGPRPVQVVRPFAQMKKRQVMQLGRELPLHLTFSCIAPRGQIHCGDCNKCAERKAAFRDAEMADPTHYANNGRGLH